MVKLLYDYVAKFETEIEISVFPKGFDDMLSKFGESPVQKQMINTTVVASSAPLIADDNKDDFCKIQNEAYKKGLEDGQ